MSDSISGVIAYDAGDAESGDLPLKVNDNGDGTFSIVVSEPQMGTLIANQTTIIAKLTAIEARLNVGLNVKIVTSL